MKKLDRAAALAVIFCWVWITPTPALAQLDSVVVNITSPASASTVSGTGSLTVAGVQFKLDGANLGAEDTSARYEVSWDTTKTGGGSHSLTAVARDLLGRLWTSDPGTVTVFNDATRPTVSITSPSSRSPVSGTITVTASASDNLGVVGAQFKLDGDNLGAEDTSAPYSVSWDTTTVRNGSHTLTARARDAAGNATTSSKVTVSVKKKDTSPPTVTITSPSPGPPVSGNITVTADAADNVGVASVQFKLDGDKNLGPKDSSAPYAVSWDTTTVSNGSHALTAQARDAAGNAITSSAVTVTVFNDTSPPTFTITSPSSGSTVCGAIAVTASAPDKADVAAVQFRDDGSDVGSGETCA